MKKNKCHISPSKQFVIVSIILTLLSISLYWFPILFNGFMGLLSIIAGIIFWDYLQSRQKILIQVKRQVKHNLPVNTASIIQIKIANHHQTPKEILFHDHYPTHFNVTNLPYRQKIDAKKEGQFEYQIIPQNRGDALFTGYDLEVRSMFKFWVKSCFVPLQQTVKIFPNFKEIVNLTLLGTKHQLGTVGIHQQQKRGEGSDFHQLRDYITGDSMRQIDWNSTSRYQKLISKEYQDERDQHIIFLLDCGRRMQHQDQGRIHLDQSLNAMLVLSFIALKQGDSAGFMTFGGVQRWLPPQKQANTITHLLDQTYDIHPTHFASDYLAAAETLRQRYHRRAMIVILTNSRDENFDDLQQAVKLLRRQHLVVIANLREALINETIEMPVNTFDEALKFNATQEYINVRQKQHQHLSHIGAIILDVTAAQLPIALVNQYLAIKRAGRL